MLSPLPRRSGWATFAHSTQPYQPSPKGLSGRPAHRPFRGLLGVHSRYGLHTRAVTVYRDTLTEGFSHFVTSIAAPVASGWSGCRVGFAPTGERRLGTAHTLSRLCVTLHCIEKVGLLFNCTTEFRSLAGHSADKAKSPNAVFVAQRYYARSGTRVILAPSPFNRSSIRS